MTSIEWVVCDIGETLVDDTREFDRWAKWLDVPRHTLSGLVGAIGLTQSNTRALQLIRPGLDLTAEYRRREQAGLGEQIEEIDLYPDVRPAFEGLRARGIRVGIAGNQTAQAARQLRGLHLPAEWVATSGEWELSKPDPAFFDRIIERAGAPPQSIAYVGDHPYKDLRPARQAGMRTVHIRRGPIGYLVATDPLVQGTADWRITTLTELEVVLR